MHMTITRPTTGLANPKGRVRLVNRHGTSLETRPLLCEVGAHQTWADPVAMPFRDGHFASVDCLDLLAYVHDDQATIDELARIMKPGGKLLLRVPNEGVTAGLDAYNLCRYLADGTHRGGRPSETDELGWRRHFRNRELAIMLESAGFQVADSRTNGTGLSELGQLLAIIGFHWIKRSEESYQRLVRWLARIRDMDNRIPAAGLGFTRTVVAVREDDASMLLPSIAVPQEQGL